VQARAGALPIVLESIRLLVAVKIGKILTKVKSVLGLTFDFFNEI
jgi:hypothetical protein